MQKMFRAFSFLFLFLICTFLWLLHSLPTLYQYLDEDGGEATKRKTVTLDQAKLPGIVICNNLPYTQGSLNAFGKAFNKDSLLQYLQAWLNPALIDSPNYETMSEEDRKSAESTVAQILPNAGLKQRIDQIFLKCQDFVSSCIIHGKSISGFECCKNVEPFLATLNGICWVFRNKTFQQSVVDNRFGIQITFQITKNSFISSSQAEHPGLSVFLTTNDEPQTRISIATQLKTQNFKLINKHQVTVFVQKQIETNLRQRGCSNTFNTKTINSSFIPCLIEAAVQKCVCVPLIAVLWTLQGDLDVSFLRRFEVSSICTVEKYNQCARKYVNQNHPDRWLSLRSLNSFQSLKHSVEYCRRSTQMPCHRTTFKSIQTEETSLPQEYKNTQDFVSRFSVAYDSLDATEIVYNRVIGFKEIITTLGYNFATWFAIGHSIWTFMTWFFLFNARSNKHKIKPCQSMVVTSPIEIQTRHTHQTKQLPPLEI